MLDLFPRKKLRARRPDILKKDNLWKTQIQKFKAPKQATKFVKTLTKPSSFLIQPASHLWVYKVYLKSQKTISKKTNFFPFSYDGKNVSLFLNSDKQKVFVTCMSVVF